MHKRLSALPATLAIAVAAASAQTVRPNIIFLLSDDQRWSTLGAMGDTVIQTPEIDALATQGATFENAFATTAICFASRASIFSGQHYSRHGLNGFSSVFTAAALAQTYPMVLRSAGYQTGFIGKWGLGNPLPVSGFDNWYGFAGQGDYEIKRNGVVVQHLTAKMGDQAMQFLDSTSRTKPFCLSLSFKAPHIQDGDPRQFIPDPADMGLYANSFFPAPPNADPAFFQALPAFLKDTNTEMRKRWNLEYRTPALYQESMKNYYRLITGADRVVGRIRKKLVELGIDGNTVIVYSSDHGMFVGDRGFAGKWLPYEASIRIPLVLFDPRAPAKERGIRIAATALNVDIPSTLLAMAGVAAPSGMQGKSLLPLIKGTAREWRTEFFYDHTWVSAGVPASQALVGSRFKYVIYPFAQPPYEELYDLRADPTEAKNLIGLAGYKQVQDSIKTRFGILKVSVAKDNAVKELQAPIAGTRVNRSVRPNPGTWQAWSGFLPAGFDLLGKSRSAINPAPFPMP